MDQPEVGRKRVSVGGREFMGSPVAVRNSNEQWNEYQLEDGSTIRLRTVATEVLRIDGEFDPDGNPMYVVKSGNVMSVNAPEELRRAQ